MTRVNRCRCLRRHSTATGYVACRFATRKISGHGTFAVVNTAARRNPEVWLVETAAGAYTLATELGYQPYRLAGVTS